jgi:hypothetical protein
LTDGLEPAERADEEAIDRAGAPASSTLEDRVDALAANGARAFDAAALGELSSLIARAGAVCGAAGDRLHARAERCAAALELRLAAARLEATGLVDALGASAPAHARSRLAAMLAAGDLASLRRAARRRPVASRHATAAPDLAWHARLAAEAHARDVEPRHALALAPARSTETSLRVAIAALARALYDRSLDEAAAACALARATDAVPSASGPYNALALATRALGELGALSPAYLRAQLARLEDLGELLGFPAEAPSPRARPRRRY